MIAAAKSLFLERGFDAVTLTQIVQRSGGSLSTLYEVFGNKLGLLGAVVEAERFEGVARLRIILSSDAPPPEVLAIAGSHLLDLMANPDFVGLARLVMCEALTSPEFAAHVYVGSHRPLLDEFTARFRRWDDEGRACIPDPTVSAHIFTSLFFQAPQLRAMFRDIAAAELSLCKVTINRTIDMFLAGAAIGGQEHGGAAGKKRAGPEDPTRKVLGEDA